MTVSRSNSLVSEDGLGDVYDETRYLKLLRPLWECSSDEIRCHTSLRTLVNFCLGHSFLFASRQRREICITDLRTSVLSNQGSRSLPVALIVATESSAGGTLFSGCLRARNVDMCPVATIAMYLFSRFHIADAYGNTEQGPDFSDPHAFRGIKLMKGSNSLQPMSYLQQHKSSMKALGLAGISEHKNSSLTKLLNTTWNDDLSRNDRPQLVNLNNLPEQIVYKLAGFERACDYYIGRDSIEPPPEVVRQIFPFIDTVSEREDPLALQMKLLFAYLRQVLVQDMAVIKQRYPQNPVLLHPFFNSPRFNTFAAKSNHAAALGGAFMSSPSLSPSFLPESLIQVSDEHLPLRKHSDSLRLYDQLRRQELALRQQAQMLHQIQESVTGLQILYQTRSAGASVMGEHSLNRVASSLEQLRTYSAESHLEIKNLAKYVESCGRETHLSQLQLAASAAEEEFASKRNHALLRRLSRNATTLYEMWDDFKSLEKGLAENGITTTEWLKVHGSSERQFRHTRMKIIRFVEEEALRRGDSVEKVKHMLYEKMRNRQRPWTIDEVQRQLTAGRRIDL